MNQISILVLQDLKFFRLGIVKMFEMILETWQKSLVMKKLRRNTDLLGQDRVDRNGRPFVFLNSFVISSKSLITENENTE